LSVLGHANAQTIEFEVDNLKYRIVDNDIASTLSVEVCGTAADLNGVDLVIPSHVAYKNDIYAVVGIANNHSNGVFAHTGILSVKIPDTVTYIGDAAFYNNENLTSVELGNSVKTIGALAFSSCDLKEIRMPESVTELGESAFYGNSNMTTAILSDAITELQHYTFFGCRLLDNIVLPASLTAIHDNAMEACSSLTHIEIPSNVKTIGISAFSGATNLSSVIFNEGLESIGYWAFNGATIIDVTLPSTINALSYQNFTNAIVGRIKATTPPDVELSADPTRYPDVFGKTGIIIVPSGCKDAYMQHDYWSTKNIVEEGHDAEIELDGVTPVNDLITAKYPFNLSETTTLRLSGKMTDACFEEISKLGISLYYIDMRRADCESIPKNAFVVRSTPGSTINIFNNIIDYRLPDNLKSIGQNAFSDNRTQCFVALSDQLKFTGDESIGYPDDLYIAKGNYINLFLAKNKFPKRIYCVDTNPQILYNYRPVGKLFVPAGCAEIYKSLIVSGYDEISEMYVMEVDKNGKTVTLTPNIPDITLGDVRINGVEAPLISEGTYSVPESAVEGSDKIELSVNFFHKDVEMTAVHNLTDELSSVNDVETQSEHTECCRYDLYGRKLDAPSKGVNIVVYTDGTASKQIVY